MTNNLSKKRPSIFISHRTRDREIAEKISSFINEATSGNVDVFYSSDEGGKGLSVGKITSYEIAENLKKCSVVILLYTRTEEDWSYCTWECGVAFDPEHILSQNEECSTKIIVFRFPQSMPGPLSAGVYVNVESKTSIFQFVRQLLTDEQFFPGHGSASTGLDKNDPLIDRYGRRLQEYLVKLQSSWESQQKSKIWLRMTFELDLRNIVQGTTVGCGNSEDSDRKTIWTNLRVYDERYNEAFRIFGLTEANGRTLKDLFDEWERCNPGEDTQWLNFLITQIIDATHGRRTEPNWRLLRTGRRESFIPIVLSYLKIPFDQKSFIEVCFLEINRTLTVPETDSRSHESSSTRPRYDDPPVLGNNFLESITGTNFLWIEGSNFSMGSDEIYADAHASPRHNVQISSFWLAETPITRIQYQSFIESTGHVQPSRWLENRFSQPQQPVVGITWDDAMEYTKWLAKETKLNIKLPTEAQWEFAARGPQGNIYPWGDEPPNDTLACFGQGQPCPVGSFRNGRGSFGILDQSGNVWEWCEDEWDESAYEKRAENTLDPIVSGLNTSWRVVRGGSWDLQEPETRYLMSAYRMGNLRDIQHLAHGFRIALIPKKT